MYNPLRYSYLSVRTVLRSVYIYLCLIFCSYFLYFGSWPITLVFCFSFNNEILLLQIGMVKSQGKLTVICHGDLWWSNVLFKYDPDAGTPTEVKFIDFQSSRVASLGRDMSYSYQMLLLHFFIY